MIDDWAAEVDKGLFCGLAFIDMRKAFDSVNHDVLLRKLALCGCSDHALTWFKSYLCEREQFTEVGGSKSQTRTTSSGVPQGSVLGPLLFTIYINDLPASVKTGKVYMFADDATIFVSGSSLESVEAQLNDAIKEVAVWTKHNRLVLNVKKTKVMLLSTRQRLGTVENKKLSVKMNGVELERVTQYKCLGVIIDESLSFKYHIESIVKTMQQKLGMVRRIKHLFTQDQLSKLYWGFILPHARYY